MTCYVCANPTCVDDCQNYPPPALKVGSAEQKLQELLKIADELAEYPLEWDELEPRCHHCGGVYNRMTEKTKHNHDCTILKLERFKKTL